MNKPPRRSLAGMRLHRNEWNEHAQGLKTAEFNPLRLCKDEAERQELRRLLLKASKGA